MKNNYKSVKQMNIEMIPIDKIRISDLNIRAENYFGDEEDTELVENIGSIGILQPIIVRLVGDMYEVDVGRRRFLSAKQIGINEIPCIVREASEEEAMDASLSENVFRKGVDPVTLGRAIKRRLAAGDISLSEYSRIIGKPKSTLSEWLRMNDLSQAIQNEVQSGNIPFTYALKVARMELSPEEENILADESRTGGFEAFKNALDRVKEGKEKRGAPKGLLIVRINFGLDSQDYKDLKQLSDAKGVDLGDYCMNILTDHIRTSNK